MNPSRVSGIPTVHLVMSGAAFYGHIKPMVYLAIRIENLTPTIITLLVANTLVDAIEQELFDLLNVHVQEERRHYIKVTGLKCSNSPFDTDIINQAFDQTYKLLANGKPISVSNSEVLTRFPTPTAAIIDLVGWEFLRSIRATSGPSFPVFVLQGSSATQMFLASAPESLGGRGDFSAKIESQSKVHDIPETEIRGFAQKMWEETSGRIVEGAGMVPMHDYEAYPQEVIESAAILAWKSWCAPRPVLPLGPLTSIEESSFRPSAAAISSSIADFIDSVYESFGAQSLIYISFGTVFWTKEPQKVWAMLDILISRKVPFSTRREILAHSSPQASIPPGVVDRVKASKLGIFCRWAPQQYILHHPATGWFISHCGQSSMFESLLAGVPLICWPFRGDQPFNAVTLCETLNVAYELFEARNGRHGLAPILRLGDRAPEGTLEAFSAEFLRVLDDAKGEDGAVKRSNVKEISDQLKGTWMNKGSGYVELRRLVQYMFGQ